LRYSIRPWGFRWTIRTRLHRPPDNLRNRMNLP
jgi:hypothetical protein